MFFNFANNLRPGQSHGEYLTQEGQITWGKWFVIQTAGGLFDKDTVDAGNTPTTIIRPGLALGVITATKQITHWNPFAVDGSNALLGFYCGPSQNMDIFGTVTERWMGDILVAGNVKADQVFVGGAAAAGISGVSYEYALREAAKHKFLFDDDMGMYVAPKVAEILATTFTVTKPMHQTLFVLPVAAAATSTITLPAPLPGLRFGFLNLSTTVGIEIVLDGPATGEFWVAGQAANTLTIAGDTSTITWIHGVRDADTPTYRYVAEA